MNNDDILATFKKHLSGIEEIDSSFTKTHIHNFGETMKGINECIGAVQIINLNLHKIKNMPSDFNYRNYDLKAVLNCRRRNERF